MQIKSFSKRRLLARTIAAVFVGGAFLAPGIAPEAHAQLTWDANGTGAGQTDGVGVWLTANQWWNGAANATWTSGSNAVFGNGGAGGAVTLASATTVGSLTFNTFTGTYTLGTAANTITLNNGITKNAGGTAATIISPITLGAAQTWTNNSSGLLTVGTGAVTNGGFLLTVGGTGNTTISSVMSGTGGITKTGSGTLTLSGVNTHTGATTVSAGTVSLSGARTAAATGGFNVGNLAGSTGTLNVSAGTFTVGTTGSNFLVGSGAGSIGIMNQSGGTLTTAGNQLLIGNTGGTGTYNLSGGTLTTIAGSLGVTVGVNTGSTATFNLSGGTLNMPATSTLQITRSDNSAATGVTGTFAQTAGTATVGILQIGGSNTTPANNANANATLNLSGGTFNATTFNQLSGANNSVSTINISGTANVTLPAFPTARGTGATATITFDGGTLSPRAASASYMGGLTNAFIKAGGARFNTTNGSITITQDLLTDGVSLGGGLTKDGTNALTLAGANTYTGATTVNAGTLTLDYGSQDNSKLSDSTALVLGASTLDLSGGTHSETVASTTLTTLTASNVTRSSGNAIINLNTITPNAGASINFGASNIATTDNLNNANGILGFWATVGGTDWAANSTNSADGLITAYTGNIDVQRLTPGVIADGATTNVRLVEGSGAAGNITLGAATTTINSLIQSTTGGSSAATIDPAGQTLATNAILVGTGAGSLTIGTGVNNGALSTASVGGDLMLINNSVNGFTINSVIADNTSASTLTKTGAGTVTLLGANTYTGTTIINAGTLQIANGGTSGSIAGTSGVTNNTALVYNRSDVASIGYVISGTGTVTQQGTGTLTLTNANTYTGATTISAGTLEIGGSGTLGNGAYAGAISNAGALNYSSSAAQTLSGVISGAGTLSSSGSGTLTLSAANTYSGGTTISASGTLAASVAGALGTGSTTNNGTLNLTGGALTYTGLSSTTPGALGGNGIVNVTLGTGTGTTALNGNYSTFTGTWNVGIGAAAGAGKVQMNGVDNAAATVNLLTNATLYSNGAGVVHNAAIVLNGGDTGESIGQLRLESGAVWAGPVTLAGNITGTGDGFFGNNTAGNIGTISGNIGETGGSRTLSKVGAGTIVLSGTNTYTGPTTIGAGVLVAQGSVGAALPTTSAVNLGAGTLQVLNNAAGTIAQSNNITLTAGVTAGISVGNAGGTTTGSTVAFGALNNGTTANAFASTFNFTGANDYLQSYASLALSGGTGQNTTLNPTTTSVTILGNVTNQMTGYGTGNFDTLTLGGTSTGNAINGIISDAATGTPAVNSGDTRIAKSGTSTWTLNGPNTYIGTTTITGGVLRITNGSALGATTSGTTQSGTSALEIDGSGGPVVVGAEALSINGGGITNLGALRNIAGDNTYGGTVTLAAQSRINSDSGTLTLNNATAVTGAGQNLVIGGAGNITISGAVTTTTGFISRDGTGTLTLAGANTYTGATSASAGTIALDYSAQDNSKLSDTAALTLGNATLDLRGGTHSEIVVSTSLTAGTTSAVTRASGAAIINLNTITPGAGATINFGESNIATTDNTNLLGGTLLGSWATVGGIDWATNSTNAADGLITAYTGYTDVQRLTPGIIADGSATNVRLIEGTGSAGNITLGAAITTINTLNQSATGGSSAATIDPAGQTLATNAILVGAGAGALTIGTGVNNGTLTSATPGGDLAFTNNTVNGLTINSVIANNTSASTVTKLGAGTLILNGNNTYTGVTTLSNGTLVLGNAGALGTGALTILGGSIASTGTIVTANPVNANGDFIITGTGALTLGATTLSGARTITNNNTTATTNFGAISGTNTALTFAGNGSTNVAGAIATGTGALTKTGLGTLTLAGANTYTGTTTISGGTLAVTGSTNQGTGSTDVLVANTASGNAVLKIQGSMTARYLTVGNVTGASGAVYMTTGGSFTGGADNELGFTFGAGATTGGYGYYGMDGGTVNTNRFQFGGQNVATQNGVGVGLISGGTVNAGAYVILSRYGTTPGTIGTLTVATGGTLNHTAATAGHNLALGWQGTGRAELNLTGGTITSATGRSLAFGGGGATWTGTGIANLNAGTLTITNITSQGTGATSYLNFNGGTLRAVSTQTGFLPALTGVYVNGAFGSFNGGAVFDSNGFNVTVAANLIAPTGNGVATIPVTDGGSGYIGAPAVSITDGGTGFGATAIANMVDDGTGNGTFKIGSITITNPGNNYTAPAVSLVGGGNGVTAATLGTATSTVNTSGGLTKNGAGSLILGGTNTYTGGTTVNSGIVQITNASALGTGDVAVAAGAQVFVNANNLTVANNFALNGTTTGGALYSGDRPAGNVTNLTGMITLNADSNISHWWNDKTLQLSGKITGTGGLSMDLRSGAVGGRFLISGSTNDYQGATSVTGATAGQGAYSGQAMLYLGANNALPTTTNLTLNYADLYLNGQSQTLPSISGTGTFSVQNGSTAPATLTLGAGDATSTFSGAIRDNGISVTNTSTTPATVIGTVALTKTGTGTLTLSGNTSNFTGDVAVNGGTLAAAAVAGGGGNSVLGSALNTRTISVNSGATLRFEVANVFNGNFSTTAVPTLNINGGTVTNANPTALPNGVNNALNNVTLASGTLTATVGQINGYAAWNINGTITSTGTSLISTSDPTFGTVMLNSTGAANVPTNTTVDVQSGVLTISAPLVQGVPDMKVSGLVKTGAGLLTLTGANSYTGGTTISAGTLQVGPGGTVGTGPVTNNAIFSVARAGLTTAAITGTGTTDVTAASATLTASSIRQSVLSIGATSTATVAPSLGNKSAGISVFTNTTGASLSIAAGGNFDTNDNDLIVYYQPGQGAATLATIQQQIIDGFLNTPAVAKISSSTGAVDGDKFLVAIDNGALGLTDWEGVTLTGSNQIIAKYTLFGDLNLDGSVDSFDYSVIDSNFGTGNSWLSGDSNLDGMVDSFDYSTVDTNFGKSFPSMGGGAANLSIAAVPEPSTFVLGGLGLLGLAGLKLRRKKV